jgi:hypothetical protein
MSTSDGVQKRNAFAACADLALPAFRAPLAVSCRIGSSVKRAWRLPRRTAGNQPMADSGSVFGSKCDDNVGRFGFVRLQPIRIGVAPVGNVHHLGRLGTRAPASEAFSLHRARGPAPATMFSRRKLGALGRCRFLTSYLTLRFIADSLPRLLSISY